MIDTKPYIPLIIEASRDAGIKILEVYNSEDFGVQTKKDDSPVTKADILAQKAINEKLKTTDFPILGEEGKSIAYEERKDWETFWLVDPLDGTKEFLKKNGEFTVNIALIHKNEPVLGVVFAPTLDEIYFGGINHGAYKDETMDREHKIKLVKNKTGVTRIATSRSHINEETRAYIQQFDDAKVVPMGSSLKFMLIADNEVDIYPRFGPTMEWDTGAAHAILKALDLEVINVETNKPLTYNKENLRNPNFIVKT